MDFKEYIVNIREKNNLTRKELSEKLDVSVRIIESWEYGNRKPKPLTIEAIKARLSHLT